jgi:hypothetical protein
MGTPSGVQSVGCDVATGTPTRSLAPKRFCLDAEATLISMSWLNVVSLADYKGGRRWLLS